MVATTNLQESTMSASVLLGQVYKRSRPEIDSLHEAYKIFYFCICGFVLILFPGCCCCYSVYSSNQQTNKKQKQTNKQKSPVYSFKGLLCVVAQDFVNGNATMHYEMIVRGRVKKSLQPSFFSSHGCIYTKVAVSTSSMNLCLSCHVTWTVLHSWLHYGISIKTMLLDTTNCAKIGGKFELRENHEVVF